MRISLLIRDLGYAGAQRQVIALAKGLHQRGDEVTVFSFYGGPLEAELAGAGIRTVSFGKKHRWDMAGFLNRAVKGLRAAQPEVLYTFLNESNLLGAVLKPFLPGTRLVWGLRDSESDGALYGWLGVAVFQLSRVLSRVPHLLIANSHSGAAYYGRQGYPTNRLRVVPNGIDVERFQPDTEAGQRVRKELGIKDDERLFGIVGRLSPMKDYATFLAAAALVKEPKVRFMGVGTGSKEYTDQMHQFASDLGLQVIWSPPRNDMPAVFNALDVLVSSSFFGEGFSNVVGEAMACGTPCVVTDVGDSVRLVGKAGISVPRGDPEKLATAMRECLQSGRTFQPRERIVEHFTVPTMVERTAGLLQDPAAIPSSSHPSNHPAIQSSPALVRVQFIITALGSGGAEMMLAQIVTDLDRTRFEPHVISLTDGGKHADSLRAAGVPVHSLGMPAGKPTPGALLKLRALTRQIAPDLLVGWMYHGNLAATLAAWFAHRVPVLWNVRQSLYSLALEKRSSALVIKLLVRIGFNPRAILYNSAVSAGQHEAIGYPKAKTVLIPNGFDTSRFAPDEAARASVRTELGVAPETVLIGRFGRHTAMKDYPTFLAAMKEVPGAHAIIAGTGTSDIIVEPELKARVHVLGERTDLARLTAALDIACSSSAFGEGFPNVVAEAMCCGIPCVVTDVGDSAWLLQDAGTAVPAENPSALAAALRAMIALPANECHRLGTSGRQRILEHFALPAVVRQFEAHLSATLSPHPTPSPLPCAA